MNGIFLEAFTPSYRPVTLYISGQKPIVFTEGDTRNKELLMRQIINAYYPNLAGVMNVDGKIVRSELINKSQKNIGIMYEIVAISKELGETIKTPSDYIRFIRDYKEDLFKPDGDFFERVYKRLESVSQSGVTIEDAACDYLKSLIKQKTGVDIQIVKPTEQEDKSGIDAAFDYRGSRYTAQIKTLNTIELIDEFYHVKISGDLTDIKTQYVIFISKDLTQKWIFAGKNITRDSSDSEYLVPKTNLKGQSVPLS